MPRENMEIVRKLFEGWNAGGYTATREFFDPDVEFVRIAHDSTGLTGEWRGSDQMWWAIGEWLRSWEDVRVEVEWLSDLGDRVLALTRQTGRGRRSDVPLDKELADFFTVRDGRIVRWESYWDRAEGLEAVGLRE